MNSQEIIAFAQGIFDKEVAEIQSVRGRIDASFFEAIQFILKTQGKIVAVGVGKNAPIAQKMVATLNSTGTVAQFLHAGEAMHGDLGLVNAEDVAIVFSKSGNTGEIRQMLPSLKKMAAKVIAITGNLDSYLAKQADIVLDTVVSEEAGPNGLAPTSSTTVQLVMCDAIAMTIKKIKQFSPEDFGMYHPGGALGKQLSWTLEDIVDASQKPQVSPTASIKEVIQSLSSGRFGITVLLENQKILGVITDGDLRRMLEKYTDFSTLCAKDIASLNPKTIYKNTLAKDALRMINDYAIGQLVVVDEADNYYGIIDFHSLTNEGIQA